ncbi:4Fe-4S binding protein [Sporomusa carbonis]|uniref:4Fe-4S binding protein n=1 Tax=Sporomusa carbonis TaxID=3076075 RepID=UPI003C7C8D11
MQKLSVLLGGSRKAETNIVKSIYPEVSVAENDWVKTQAIMARKGEEFFGQAIIAITEGRATGIKIFAFDGDKCSDVATPDSKITVQDIDFLALKRNGMLRQVDDGYYSIRLKITGGNMSAGMLAAVSRIAEKFGKGSVHITSRQGMEIPFIHIADLDEFFAELKAAGIELGASGPRVRAVVACQGNLVCPNGLIDTSLAEEVANRFFAKETAHKFKIGITGCPNNCLKADENDLGIKGVVKVSWCKDTCKYCGACAKVCPVQAISVNTDVQTVELAEEKCIGCGKCFRACAFDSITAQAGYRMTFGGTFGRNIVSGTALYPFVASKEDVFKIIAASIDFFSEHGQSKERLNKTIARTGWAEFERYLEGKLRV